jgi:hypothetical protein
LIFAYTTVEPAYSFASDSLNKLIQSYSLIENRFLSDNLHYSFRDVDPDYNFYPADYVLYHLRLGSKHVGPFSVFFSIFTSPLFIFPIWVLPLVSGLIYLIGLWVLKKYWNVSNIILFLTACGTSLLIYAVEYSENIYFIFLHFISITLFLKKEKQTILAGILMGLSVYLRLETLLGFPFYVIAYVIVYGIKDKESFKKIFLFGSAFTLTVFLFLLFNQINYGHYLGPKYLVDQSNFWNFETKFRIYLSLFFGLMQLGFFKLGFFGLTPFFLVPLFLLFKEFNSLEKDIRFLFISSIMYFLIAPALSPHDGHWSWGARYFSLLVFPFAILSQESLNIILSKYNKKFILVIFYFLVTYSIIMTQVGLKIVGVSSRVMKEVQTIMNILPGADIRLFNNEAFALHTGPQLLKEPSVLARNKDSLSDLILMIKKHSPGKKIVFIHSSLLNRMLQSSGIVINSDLEEYKQLLSKELIFLESREIQKFEIEALYYKIPAYQFKADIK